MSSSPGFVHRVRAIVDLDFHVFMTLLFRSWSIIAGAATVLLVPFFLSPIEQGYYYTFAGILGLHIFFELGLSQVVVQLVGHEIAHLRIVGTALEGDVKRIDRLASLVHLLRQWYVIAAVLFALVGGLIGAVFFELRGQLPLRDWGGVWLLLTLATAVNLAYMPALALIEGTGQIGHVARLRLAQSALGYAALWMVLYFGGHLWAAASVSVITAILTSCWLRKEGKLYFWLRSRTFPTAHRIDWRTDVLPFQWRIAASWISGYFIFYAFTPLIFSHRGAAEAGRFGMAMTVFNSVSAVGMSWVNAKAPAFGMHISRGERTALNTLFLRVFKRSLTFTIIASISVCAAAYILADRGITVMQRAAEPSVIACLALVCIINCIVFSVATYMRAHREEPMLPVSVVAGAATALIAYFGSMHSVFLMSVAYLLMNLLLSLPWSLHLFMQYYRRIA
jgi:hypothetical protein